jgi:hypothetical protein
LRLPLNRDAAAGLGNMGRLCFAGATQIVDFYPALEHAVQLLKDQAEKLIAETRKECAGKLRPIRWRENGYFVSIIDGMQYGKLRRRGFFIGSVVIEAGCKTVIGVRCKQSGMFWGRAGAEDVLALRRIHSGRRLECSWKERLNDHNHAARNDCLALAA